MKIKLPPKTVPLHKPHNVQIELTRGCNFNCSFCAIDVVPKNFAFMTLDTAKVIGEKFKVFDPLRIEYAMRGEPTLNPDLVPITAALRAACTTSQITLTTNGSKLTKQMAEQFLAAGGNIIIVDCYGNSYDAYKRRLEGLPLVDFYDDKFYPWYRHSPKTKIVCLMRDLSVYKGKKMSRTIINQAGNLSPERLAKHGKVPLAAPLKKKCTHPFRELTVFWDGRMPICCRDWSEKAITGNIHNIADLETFWQQSKVHQAYRTLLANKRRDFGICQKCDYFGGMRQGLLGKMPTITSEQHFRALKAQAEAVYK